MRFGGRQVKRRGFRCVAPGGETVTFINLCPTGDRKGKGKQNGSRIIPFRTGGGRRRRMNEITVYLWNGFMSGRQELVFIHGLIQLLRHGAAFHSTGPAIIFHRGPFCDALTCPNR